MTPALMKRVGDFLAANPKGPAAGASKTAAARRKKRE